MYEIAGLDSSLERGTGMWDWNVGLEFHFSARVATSQAAQLGQKTGPEATFYLFPGPLTWLLSFPSPLLAIPGPFFLAGGRYVGP